MNDKEQSYQALTLFDFLERHYPGYPSHRQRDLPLNILALPAVIVGGEIWKALLLNGLEVLNPGAVISLDSHHGLPSTVKIVPGITLADFCLD